MHTHTYISRSAIDENFFFWEYKCKIHYYSDFYVKKKEKKTHLPYKE